MYGNKNDTKSSATSATAAVESYGTLPRPDSDSDDDDDAASKATTHSKLLSRGKYVHELQTHDVIPKYVDEYKQLLAYHYPRIVSASDKAVNLVGSWETTVGELDQMGFTYINLSSMT